MAGSLRTYRGKTAYHHCTLNTACASLRSPNTISICHIQRVGTANTSGSQNTYAVCVIASEPLVPPRTCLLRPPISNSRRMGQRPARTLCQRPTRIPFWKSVNLLSFFREFQLTPSLSVSCSIITRGTVTARSIHSSVTTSSLPRSR